MRFDISLQNFKKPLVDILSPQIERKNVPKSSSLKTVNTGKPAKSFKLKLEDSGFLETL